MKKRSLVPIIASASLTFGACSPQESGSNKEDVHPEQSAVDALSMLRSLPGGVLTLVREGEVETVDGALSEDQKNQLTDMVEGSGSDHSSVDSSFRLPLDTVSLIEVSPGSRGATDDGWRCAKLISEVPMEEIAIVKANPHSSTDEITVVWPDDNDPRVCVNYSANGDDFFIAPSSSVTTE